MASLTGIAFAVAASFLSFASTVTAKASGLDAPGSPDAIGSDLTILTHNDLYGSYIISGVAWFNPSLICE